MFYKRMVTNIFLSILVFFLSCIAAYGQKPKKCKVEKDSSVPKFRVADFDRGKDSVLLLYVSINSSDITQSNLIALSKRLENIYCKEKEIITTFFDDYSVAQNATLDAISVYFEKTLESSRGEYYLNRNTGEEFVSYSVSSGYLRRGSESKRIKVILSKNNKSDTPP